MKKVEQQEEGEEGDFLACHAKGGGSFCRRHVTGSQSAASGAACTNNGCVRSPKR